MFCCGCELGLPPQEIATKDADIRRSVLNESATVQSFIATAPATTPEISIFFSSRVKFEEFSRKMQIGTNLRATGFFEGAGPSSPAVRILNRIRFQNASDSFTRRINFRGDEFRVSQRSFHVDSKTGRAHSELTRMVI